MRRHEITNEQWTAIAPLLPDKTTDFGVTAKNNHLFFNAVVGTMRTYCPWADLPKRFDKFNSVCRHFRQLAQKGVWDTALRSLQAPDPDGVILDLTVVRVHQHSAG